MLFSSPFKKYQKELKTLYEKRHLLESVEDATANSDSELRSVTAEIEGLIEGPYAEAVFAYYGEKKPILIRSLTGEEVSWEDAFGSSFNDVSKSLKHSLVGLIEGGGRYKFR